MIDREIQQWATHALSALGYSLKDDTPVSIRNTPWSNVAYFDIAHPIYDALAQHLPHIKTHEN